MQPFQNALNAAKAGGIGKAFTELQASGYISSLIPRPHLKMEPGNKAAIIWLCTIVNMLQGEYI